MYKWVYFALSLLPRRCATSRVSDLPLRVCALFSFGHARVPGLKDCRSFRRAVCRWGGHPGRAVCPESSDGHPCWHVPGRQFDMVSGLSRHRARPLSGNSPTCHRPLRVCAPHPRSRSRLPFPLPCGAGERGGCVAQGGVERTRPPVLRDVGAPPVDQQGARARGRIPSARCGAVTKRIHTPSLRYALNKNADARRKRGSSSRSFSRI